MAEVERRRGNDAGSVEALDRYLEMRPGHHPPRRRLAEALSRLGNLDEAITHYERLLAANPTDPALLTELGILYESSGKLEQAVPFYTRAIETSAEPDAELFLRLGRLHRWDSRPEEAALSYQNWAQLKGGWSPALDPVRAELAEALVDSGRADQALPHLEAILERSPHNETALLLAARAATQLEQPAPAVQYLEELSCLRELEPTEQLWLADLYRAVDRSEESLLLYESVMRDIETPSAATVETLGDLRREVGDDRGALSAYQRLDHAAGSARLLLKIAGSAAAAGEIDVAKDAYEEYLADHPREVSPRLEAARFLVQAGLADRALELYREVLELGGAEDLRFTELARAALAAEEFGEAEIWARQAIAAEEETPQADIALAQSLHLQGETKEAETVLLEVLEEARQDSEALAWLGYFAIAQDRHLKAYNFFEQAIAAGAVDAASLHLWQGKAAHERRDYLRAAKAYDRADASGIHRLELRAAREELASATVPELGVPASFFSDSNDLRLKGAGLSVGIWTGKAASLQVELGGVEVSQNDTSFTRTVASLEIDNVFAGPRLQFSGRLGIEDYRDAPNIGVGGLGIQYYYPGGSELGAGVARRSLWPAHDLREPRQFNRIIDLALLPPDFAVNSFSGYFDNRTEKDHYFRFWGGGSRFDDGNWQGSFYAHYQLPLETAYGHWTVLRPNLYLEGFKEKNVAYYSPGFHATLGTMIHTIQTSDRWVFELEANPQLLVTDGELGFGVHGLADVGVEMGPTHLGGGLFVFYDQIDDYLMWRLAGRFSVHLGGRR
jgi:tetratricopeptide (TPR) repeat protein